MSKQTSSQSFKKLPKSSKKDAQKSLLGRLWVDKRHQGTQGADMRQTLAGVCENDIRGAARDLKNIKKPPRAPPFLQFKQQQQQICKKLQKWHQQETNTEPKTTKSPTQNHIKKNIENKGAVWSMWSMEMRCPADCAGAVGHQDLAKNRPFKV